MKLTCSDWFMGFCTITRVSAGEFWLNFVSRYILGTLESNSMDAQSIRFRQVILSDHSLLSFVSGRLSFWSLLIEFQTKDGSLRNIEWKYSTFQRVAFSMFRCMIVDNSGFIVMHPQFVDASVEDQGEQRRDIIEDIHIVHQVRKIVIHSFIHSFLYHWFIHVSFIHSVILWNYSKNAHSIS